MTTQADGARRFADRFPTVWHVVEADGLAGVEAHGLLPAAELLRRAGLSAAEDNRDDFLRVPLGPADGPAAILRFQLMRDAKLAPTLHGAFAGQPGRWRALIDSQVFFWADPARRDSFLRACIRDRKRSRAVPLDTPPAVLAFQTGVLLGACADRAYHSTFNTGSTVRGGARARRDESTFRPIADYRAGPVAELAIRGALAPPLLAQARMA